MRKILEPTELYNRNKHNLIIFAGLLALVMVGEIRNLGQTEVSFLPFKFTETKNIPHVLFVIAAYCFYEFVFAWGRQSDEIRKNIWFDFFVSATLAGIVLAAYAIRYWLFDAIQAAPGFIITAVIAVGAAMAGAIISYLVSERGRWRGVTFTIRRTTIRDRLLEAGWILHFNPDLVNGFKRIEFNSDGSIGDGQNRNEFRWDMSGGSLRIWRQNDDLQNEFRYDETTDRFISTDADAAKGIKGQYIYRKVS